MERLLVERQGWVRVLTVNRPDAHNCIDAETAVAIAGAIEEFARDPDARVLVVTGAGPLSFSSGADLKHTQALWGHESFEEAGPLGFARLDPGKPTIAAVNGYCFAGGMELAAWCDFRVAAENAEFGILNRRWGVPLIDGGTQRFTRILGLGNALYLIETGVRLDARRAQALGFVQEVVPEGQALPRALELAARIAEYPQASLRSDRQAAAASLGLPLREGLLFERHLGAVTLGDPEMTEALQRFARGERPEPPRPR
ncbi:MAG TPA: enoyl-CoA hydratase-related protein [Actinomycetes bacterium]|jgi:enoyl-CoA hydratase|nr:enoyl-CoA hydratase-related protein [Actinomycetes bacterium]